MAERRGMDWRMLAILSALILLAFVLRAVFNAGHTALLADTDDAMRMVVVRDFLAGQGWYDNVQHRLNAPFGAEIHWSRLADLPLAGLILLVRPFAGGFAETIAAYALPLIWLLLLLYLSGRIALKLVGREGLLPALALPAMSLSILTEFAPGRVDHHSIQILLLLLTLWCSIEALSRPRWSIGAGLAAATSIAIGIEGLPGVVAAVLAFGLMWVTLPGRASTLRGFGLSFALGMIVHLAIGVPPARWFVPMCDAVSFAYAAAAVATGIAFVILSVIPARSIWVRLALGLVAGIAIAAGFVIAFPQCVAGPYASLDPWLLDHWINRISEAEPLLPSLFRDPIYPLAVLVPPALALVAIGFRVTRGERELRGEWLVYLSFLVLAIAAMLLQIRASRMATPLAVPACAWLIVMARHHYLERRTIARIGLLLLSWLASAGLAVAIIVSATTFLFPEYGNSLDDPEGGARKNCLMPSSFAELAAMPKTNLMNPIDLGSHLLLNTPHSVIAAPYHRNAEGVQAAFDFFDGPIDKARAILDARGVTLVVVCPSMPEIKGLPDADPTSFVRLHEKHQLPAWLTLISPPDAPLQIYQVTP